MKETPSLANDESGELAKNLYESSIKLHKALFDCQLIFPQMDIHKLLVVTGAIVHAASHGNKAKASERVEPWDKGSVTERKTAPKKRVLKTAAPAKTTTSKPKKAKKSAPKEEAPTPFWLAVCKVVQAKTMTVPEIADAIVERGWYPKDLKTKPRSYLGSMLANNKQYFVKVSPGVYRMRATALKEAASLESLTEEVQAPKEKPKGTGSKSEPSFDRDEALRHLVSHGAATTAAEIATALGISETRALTPLLVGLRDFGGLKKKEGPDGKGVWEPVEAKIRKWDADRNGGSAFKHLNGAASP